jgi:hypothetical protein
VKAKIFIVIRVGLQDNVDPIDEVDNVIEKMGYCWFGKYGEPLHQTLIERVPNKKDVAICLIYKSKTTGYRMKTYFAEEVSANPVLPKNSYPAYYSTFMNRIGTFVKVSPYKGVSPTINDLYVKSSLNKLASSLQKSIRGHFVCMSNTV